MISGMCAVVNEGGTGRAAALPNITVCGKTGTAQLAATEKTKGAKLGSALANSAWFVAFAPQQNPEIVVAALFENGVESYNAVPIVRDVLKAYFDKKAREAVGTRAAFRGCVYAEAFVRIALETRVGSFGCEAAGRIPPLMIAGLFAAWTGP